MDESITGSRTSAVLITTIVMISLSTAFTAIRLTSRFGVVKKVGWDDYAIIVAWVSILSSVDNRHSDGEFHTD